MYSPNVNSTTLAIINENIDLMLKNRNILDDIDKKRDLMIKECKELIDSQLTHKSKKKYYEYVNKIIIKDIDVNIKYNFSKYKKKWQIFWRNSIGVNRRLSSIGNGQIKARGQIIN